MSQPAIFKFPHPDAAARARHSASESLAWLRRPAAGRSDARRHCDRTTGQRRDPQSAGYRLPLAMGELQPSGRSDDRRDYREKPSTVTGTSARRPLGLGVRPAGVTVRLGSS
jgi:hypothetical protein